MKNSSQLFDKHPISISSRHTSLYNSPFRCSIHAMRLAPRLHIPKWTLRSLINSIICNTIHRPGHLDRSGPTSRPKSIRFGPTTCRCSHNRQIHAASSTSSICSSFASLSVIFNSIFVFTAPGEDRVSPSLSSWLCRFRCYRSFLEYAYLYTVT